MTKKKPSPVRHLNKAQILEAAISYADRHGADALSMRKVADQLGCGVMSLYNHVANKDEMLDGMVDSVVAKIELPALEHNWKETMRRTAESAHTVLLIHPWAVTEWSMRVPGPVRTRYMDAILKVLTEAKLPPRTVYSGYHAITMHIVGFSLQEIAYTKILKTDLAELASDFIETMSDAYPYMVDHVRAHLDDECDGDEFGFILDLILDGLERSGGQPT